MTSSADPFNFAGKVAIVTGGSNGIGRATALLFGRYGARVVIGDVNRVGKEVAQAIKADGGEARFVETDVADVKQVRNLVAAAVETYGGLHCAFNNAGMLPPAALVADFEEGDFDKTIAVDLRGVFLCMKYEIRQMLRTGGGVIVNNASIAGTIAAPGMSAYVAAKHAVIGLSRAAALEYASQGIRINALAPGVVQTGMTKHWFDDPEMHRILMASTPMGRPAQPEDLAGMVLFLCSDLASYATGQVFTIDGGYTAH